MKTSKQDERETKSYIINIWLEGPINIWTLPVNVSKYSLSNNQLENFIPIA